MNSRKSPSSRVGTVADFPLSLFSDELVGTLSSCSVPPLDVDTVSSSSSPLEYESESYVPSDWLRPYRLDFLPDFFSFSTLPCRVNRPRKEPFRSKIFDMLRP